MESNRFINGKRVEEPKPDETIDALNGLGYEIVDMKHIDSNETAIQVDDKPAKETKKESIKKLSGGGRPNHNTETMDIRKSIHKLLYIN